LILKYWIYWVSFCCEYWSSPRSICRARLIAHIYSCHPSDLPLSAQFANRLKRRGYLVFFCFYLEWIIFHIDFVEFLECVGWFYCLLMMSLCLILKCLLFAIFDLAVHIMNKLRSSDHENYLFPSNFYIYHSF